ncbi:MAG: protein kinase [Gemmatimonadaceae bacterium]
MAEWPAASLGDRYRLEREIGAGGMATVYLAHDPRHDRQVAIKVLRPELSAVLGGDRFLNEIRIAAQLQHPHILALYDSGSAEGLLYYVMPWVAGESLRRRLERERQLPVADAIRIAREVADALEYAHRQGVVHRDIKPDNILLHDGRALVADFGIALAVRNAGGTRLTGTGFSMGTPRYMSPEQVAAERDVDGRSDVYSLGCVLYEMLAGEPPHTGPTAQAILARTIADPPRPITELRDTVPAHVAAALHTSLAKLPADRFGSAAEFAEALASPVGAELALATPRKPRQRAMAAAGVGALAMLILVGGWLLGTRSLRAPSQSMPPSRLSIPAVGLSQAGSDLRYRSLGLLADGDGVVYATGSSGDRRLLVSHRFVDNEAKPIPGTVDMYAPDVSPDGRWFFARKWRGSGVRLPVEGTAVGISLAETASIDTSAASTMTFGAWHPDGSVWLTRQPFQTIERVTPAGDDTVVMFSGLEGVRLQQILADGRTALAIEVPSGGTSGRCVAVDLRTGRISLLVDEPIVQARHTAGFLVYARPDGAFLAAPFDARSRRVTGDAVTIAEGVVLAYAGEAQFAVARNGTVAYIPTEPSTLVLVDRAGNAKLATAERRNFHNPRFSPDGRRIAVDFNTNDGRDVWVLDREQSTLTRVSFDRAGADADWTPDSRSLTYRTDRYGRATLIKIGLGSASAPDSLYRWGNPTSWLPDGSAFVAFSNDSIGLVRNGGRGPFEGVLPRRFGELSLELSPDGRWLAFVSRQNGEREVFVRRLDGQGEVVQVSQSGGAEPVWGRSGRELFYRTLAAGSEELVLAKLEIEPRFRVQSRTPLFSVADFLGAAPHANYDVSPDGRTLVMVRRSPSTRIVVIQNLPALVRGELRD